MQQTKKWKLGVLAAAVFLTISILLMASSRFTYKSMAGEGTWTPSAWIYLPFINRQEDGESPTVEPGPTDTPTLPPPSFDGCEEDPDPTSAVNFPVRIVTVEKAANPEVVRLENVSTQAVDLTDWHVCSINGNQEHTGIGGTLAAGETKDYPYAGGGFIWNNSSQDDGALYNADGQLVSYWVDQ